MKGRTKEAGIRSRRPRSGAPFFAQRRMGGGRFPVGAPVSKRTRPGTVLVMVVAMLSMLFMVGAVLLSNVAFESSSITGERKAKRQSAVVDRLLREASAALKQSFLGNDTKPFNRDSEVDAGPPSPIGNDTYGELPGVHPLLASIEPHDPVEDTGEDWFFFAATDLELVLADSVSATNLVYVDSALGVNHTHQDYQSVFNNQGDEISEGDSILLGPPGELRLFRRDADGDGVWDSYEYRLPDDRYPSSIRGDLAEQLVAADNVFDPLNENTDPDALFYALRVIPHGAMVHVGHAHKTLLEAILTPEEAALFDGPQSFVPEGEEPLLRRRFLMPPRDLPLSNLQSHPLGFGLIPVALYGSFVDNWSKFADVGDEDARWWPIDTGENGTNVGFIEDVWLPWMDPDTGDARHLLTTASHDDNLMRIGRAVATSGPNVGQDVGDWISYIVEASLDPPNSGNAVNFRIDDWPDVRLDQSDSSNMGLLNGRLKVSLQGLFDKVVADAIDEGNLVSEPVPDLDDLLGLGPNDPFYQRFVFTIQDAFILMLRNITDVNVLNDDEKMVTAAALTANLIDFADSDDIPTAVATRDFITGGPPAMPETVYGLERQPFITEVYYDLDGPYYAVELFNPYGLDDGPDLSLNGYSIATDASDPTGAQGSLNGRTLGPDEFQVIANDVGSVPDADGPVLMFPLDPNVDTRVTLLRNVDGVDVIVDSFSITLDLAGGGQKSIERNSSANKPWLATIPTTTGAIDGNSLGAHNGTEPANLLPVEVRFANTADIETAFPTTGSLLLLMRYANSEGAAFNADLVLTSNPIDDGRMPVFDAAMQAQPVGGPLDLSIPWGQLVFDYFTALPLSYAYNPDPLLAPIDMTPTIDQNGLRVHGRIDINSAPWSVLQGLPLMPKAKFNGYPESLQNKIAIAAQLNGDSDVATPIGLDLAQSIVAYREARRIGGSANFDFTAGGSRLRQATGFLTVGELANVRRPDGSCPFPCDSDFDAGAINDYVSAVAVLVALGDWVTTRSHVFTVYGTLRGAGGKSAVDQNAIRFQETVDRLPSFYNNNRPPPRRIGPRTVGPYTQASHD